MEITTTGEVKTCSQCKIAQPLEEFYRDKRARSGLKSECKACHKTYGYSPVGGGDRSAINARWRAKIGSYYLRRKCTDLGLDYDELTRTGTCFLCDREAQLVIDHSHETGEFRGLICNKCNCALGLVRDSVATLSKMISYLEPTWKG